MKRIVRPFKGQGGALNNPTHIIKHAIGEYLDFDSRDPHCLEFLDQIGLSYHRVITPNGDVIEGVDLFTQAWHCKKNSGNFIGVGVALIVPGLHTLATLTEELNKYGDQVFSDAQMDTMIEIDQEIVQIRPTIKSIKTHYDFDHSKPDFPDGFFDMDAIHNDVFGG